MSDPLFQIIFRGKLLSGVTLEQARANLAQLFRTDETRIGTMLALPKWVVKSGVAKETALKIQEAMRNAGLMVAVMADESASVAPSAVPNAAPTPSAVSAPVVVQAVQIAPVASSDIAPVNAVIDTPSDAAPLAVKPRVAAFEPDLSSFSLADVGAIIDASGPKKAERSFDVEQFSLANLGVQLSEKKLVAATPIDTSGLSLVAADIPRDPKLSALHREFGG